MNLRVVASYLFAESDSDATHTKSNLSIVCPFTRPLLLLFLFYFCLAFLCLFTTYSAVSDVSTRSIDPLETRKLIARLGEVFDDMDEYRRLLLCKGSTAQEFLDLFQLLLDDESNMSPRLERNVITAGQRLAGKSGVSPTCYQLNDVTRCATWEATGGVADIYKGYFQGKTVCVKTVRVSNAHIDIELLWKDVLKEAILWGHLKHPNILPFHGVYRDKSMMSLVAPWMDNGDLVTYLKRHKDSNRVALAHDVAQGLQFLHNKSIIHGDLKGANVLINDSKRACISDFGFSSILDGGILTWASQPRLASTGGTVRWQAPELFEPELEDEEAGDAEVHNTKATDIYAFGGLAYEVFAGQVPFANISAHTIVHKVMQGQRPKRPTYSSPSWKVWGLTETIWGLIKACWEADPLRRPTINEVVERLKLALPQGMEEINNGSPQSPGEFQEKLHRSLTDLNMSIEFLESVVASG